MPSNYGQTGWQHLDPKVRRDFERIARSFGNLDKDINTLAKDLSGISGKSKDWILEVLHNMNSVTKPTLQLNFRDNDDIQLVVRQTNKNQATVEVILLDTSSASNPYNTLWESKESNIHGYSTPGAVNTIGGYTYSTIPISMNEIANRQLQFKTPGGTTNNGDGWIPVKANQEVIIDNENLVSHVNRIYIRLPYPWDRDTLFFSPVKTGAYKFDISLYIKAAFFDQALAPALKDYDSIDRGMLIAEKCTTTQITDGGYTDHNPLTYNSGVETNANQLYLIDSRFRFGDVDYTRVNANVGGFTISNPAALHTSDTSAGCTMSMMYNPEINLGGSFEIYLEEGDMIMFWYKIYGHNIKHDGTRYNTAQPVAYNASLTPNERLLDYVMHIDQRYERVAISYLGNNAETTNETNRQNIRTIVERF